ncbi:MAG: hypothetical protein IPP57_24300 [Candidatus Obscuribacter sp.]|jgi:hypothetical protein|nr:hypothetical protein [Candidatus Obscuribacter sp.]MBK7748885.1 hypothetical protein [Candidatus Obscuribacter sp.]MBK7839859.1 hypothetical protein [Candidatus Obscuribacter sp.]MBK9621498.1 hypothetical protein [Candidatus Obscuribacter sp.]MBK9773899.1 hypothetical protein [Candidatus Obscuribacter sp.]
MIRTLIGYALLCLVFGWLCHTAVEYVADYSKQKEYERSLQKALDSQDIRLVPAPMPR